MRGPVISELGAGFLARHALLNPFIAPSMFPPGGAGSLKRERGVRHLLHPLVANF